MYFQPSWTMCKQWRVNTIIKARLVIWTRSFGACGAGVSLPSGRRAEGAAGGGRIGGRSSKKADSPCLLSVDGVIQLLHLLVGEDTISEVWLELLQGQLPVVWKATHPWSRSLRLLTADNHDTREVSVCVTRSSVLSSRLKVGLRTHTVKTLPDWARISSACHLSHLWRPRDCCQAAEVQAKVQQIISSVSFRTRCQLTAWVTLDMIHFAAEDFFFIVGAKNSKYFSL